MFYCLEHLFENVHGIFEKQENVIVNSHNDYVTGTRLYLMGYDPEFSVPLGKNLSLQLYLHFSKVINTGS